MLLFVFGVIGIVISTDIRRDSVKAKLISSKDFTFERAGDARGNSIYVLTDKAGNKWFVNGEVAIPLKDR